MILFVQQFSRSTIFEIIFLRILLFCAPLVATVRQALQVSKPVRVAPDEAEELAQLRSSYPSLVRADNGRHFLAELAEVNVDPGVQA